MIHVMKNVDCVKILMIIVKNVIQISFSISMTISAMQLVQMENMVLKEYFINKNLIKKNKKITLIHFFVILVMIIVKHVNLNLLIV